MVTSVIVASVAALLQVSLTACDYEFDGAKTADQNRLPGYVWQVPEGFPIPQVPEDNPMTSVKVELGRQLFYDPRLSGDGTVSCSS